MSVKEARAPVPRPRSRWIEAAGVPGIAAADAVDALGGAFERAVFLHRLDEVIAAARIEAADLGQERANDDLVEPDRDEQDNRQRHASTGAREAVGRWDHRQQPEWREPEHPAEAASHAAVIAVDLRPLADEERQADNANQDDNRSQLAPARIIPFLTAKHSLEYIQLYAARAASHGFEALTVVGGDQSAGAPRCLPHAYQLRRWIRERVPSMDLGGWVNPLKDPVRQVDFLLDREFAAEFYLTQIVSHHSVAQVERFLAEARRRGVRYPGVFGVFLYRSANPRTLRQLASFLPVPAEEITGEFAAGLSAEDICARSIRALREIGVDKVYISNLGLDRPDARYRRIVELV